MAERAAAGPAPWLTENHRPLSDREFQRIRELAHRKFGLDLKQGKQQLVAARLGKKLRSGGFGSFSEYFDYVIEDDTGEALIGMIDALTTNFTSFLREPSHFDFLRERVLPGLAGRDRIDIWSAAGATGEEPYTLVFVVLDALGDGARHKLHVLATDISTRALETARKGIYPAERFEGIPAEWRRRFLLRGEGNWQGHYRVKPEVRSQVEFRRLNLVETISHVHPFPAIFCRNVMIYFDKPTQQKVISQMAQWLEPEGYLFIGHSESLTAVEHSLEYVRPAVYRKPKDGSLPARRRR